MQHVVVPDGEACTGVPCRRAWRTFTVRMTRLRKQYDSSKARKDPSAKRLKKSVTIRLDETTPGYLKDLAERVGMPYQTLINMYLRDCAESRKTLRLQWRKPADAG